MLVDTFAHRLSMALKMNNITQQELSQKTGISKSLISHYMSGDSNAKQDKLSILAQALGVSEPWLMGYNVSIDGKTDLSEDKKPTDELEVLFSKNRDILTKDDEDYIRFIIDKRKKEIDEQIERGD